jgi:hypothetical protein
MIFRRGIRKSINRRAFLRGTGGVALGLPFLEGLPERSAYGQSEAPVYSLFIMAQNGVVQDRFWPAGGPLTAQSMAGKSVEPLAEFADRLLFVNGLKHPGGSPANCGHAQGCVQAITGVAPGSGGNSSTSGGPSADIVISQALNPPGTDPLTLYSGSQKGAFIGERLSFTAAQTPARAAQQNPYETYKSLMGLSGSVVSAGDNGSSPVTEPAVTDDLLTRQRSVNDLVLDDFTSLLGSSALSAEDRTRLNNHLEGVRQFETNLLATGETMNEAADPAAQAPSAGCGAALPSQTALDAFKDGIRWSNENHMIEDVVKLHGETVALAFACDANRTATLQWGDGTDGTVYNTMSTGGYNTFHKISHRTNSDSSSGNDAWAKDAHTEIDTIRATTLAHVIGVWEQFGLLNNGFIYWTNSISDGPSHAFNPMPIVIAGSGGGFFRQGQVLSASGSNGQILASAVAATGAPVNGFAGGTQLGDAQA